MDQIDSDAVTDLEAPLARTIRTGSDLSFSFFLAVEQLIDDWLQPGSGGRAKE